MIEVSTQAQLQAALSAREPDIQITGSFPITSQISITYETAIRSLSGDNIFTLTKDPLYFGYMFRISNGGSLTLENLILDGDLANHPMDHTGNRSLIYVTNGTLNLSNGTVLQNNFSYIEGGGAYLLGDSTYTNTLVMDGNAKITGCTSRTRGGGLMLAPGSAQDRFTIADQALIDGNLAAYGGGICCRSFIPGSGISMTISDQVHITGNSASSSGGGIYFSGYQEGGSAPASLTLSETSVISGNQSYHGGGIYFYSANEKDELNLLGDATIAENTASHNGGGICLFAAGQGAVLNMNQASVTGNYGGTGGGIYLLTPSGANLTFYGGTISGNEAIDGAAGSGGGIWIKGQTGDAPIVFSMENFTLSNNSASAQGGGLALFSGPSPLTVTMTQVTISGNVSVSNGGGLLFGAEQGGTTAISQCTLEENTSKGSGGGCYYANQGTGSSTIQMTGTTVTGNQAGLEGGGLRLSSGEGRLTTVLTDCTISANTASGNSGGGIWNGGTNDTLTLKGATSVTENISEEGNGGGIYFNSDQGSLLLTENTKILYNHADVRTSPTGSHGGGVCVVPGRVTIQDQTEIAYNNALKYGGGLSSAENSETVMNSGSIHDNTSGLCGGGVWNHGGSVFRLDGGNIYANHSSYGGGICNNLEAETLLYGGSIYGNQAAIGSGLYNDTQSTAMLSRDALFGKDTPNISTNIAPGIYNKGTLYADGGRDLINGVYIENRDSVVRIQNPLAAGSRIQIDNSGYVTPNPEGSPIVIGEAVSGYPQLTQTDADAFQKPPEGFDGWSIHLSADKTQVLLEPEVYAIHYKNLMGVSNPNPDTYTITSPSIILEAPQPLTGYRFVGWFDASVGGNPITQIPSGSTGEITLYARWEAVYHIISYCGNGSCCSPARCLPPDLQVQEGQSAVISNKIPFRKRYRFRGWNTDPCGNGTFYSPGAVIPAVTDSLRLYAQWDPFCSTVCCTR